jgi:hypothetical protein
MMISTASHVSQKRREKALAARGITEAIQNSATDPSVEELAKLQANKERLAEQHRQHAAAALEIKLRVEALVAGCCIRLRLCAAL